MEDTGAHSQTRTRGRPKMVGYNSLPSPLSCEWVYPDSNLTCVQTFTDMDEFTDHVRQSHIQNPYTPGGEQAPAQEEILSGVCCWNGCNFTTLTLTSPEFINHVLYHPYHAYLKLIGAEVQRQRKLSDCQMDPSLSNLLPPLEVQLQCQWHHGECGVVFDSVGDFYGHAHDHVTSSKQQLTCLWGDCTFKTGVHGKLNEHVRTHLKEKVVACPTCGSLFANNTKLGDHLVRQQTSTRSYSCTFCHKVFSSDRLLRDHARRHVNTLQCPQCELTCQGPSRLLTHIRYRHMAVKPHECGLCHKTFKTASALSEHIETHREPSCVCTFPDCDYKASSTRALDRHVQSLHASDSMLYCCHVCNERFTVGKKLTQHLKTSHGFQLPPGHCRFRYLAGVDGLKRLQTVRLDDEHLVTPELNTYSSSSSSSLNDSATQ